MVVSEVNTYIIKYAFNFCVHNYVIFPAYPQALLLSVKLFLRKNLTVSFHVRKMRYLITNIWLFKIEWFPINSQGKSQRSKHYIHLLILVLIFGFESCDPSRLFPSFQAESSWWAPHPNHPLTEEHGLSQMCGSSFRSIFVYMSY